MPARFGVGPDPIGSTDGPASTGGRMTQPTETMMAVCMCNLAACHELAQLTLDSTERLEKIGLALARNLVNKGFAAVENAGDGAAAPAVAPDLNDWLRAQREIGDTLANASQLFAQTMSDYGSRLNETLTMSAMRMPMPMPMMPMPLPMAGIGGDAIFGLWRESYRGFGEMVQAMTAPVGAKRGATARSAATGTAAA
jgi:hypothetical protein